MTGLLPGSSRCRLSYLLHIAAYSHSGRSSRADWDRIFLQWFANVAADGNGERLEPFVPLKLFIEVGSLSRVLSILIAIMARPTDRVTKRIPDGVGDATYLQVQRLRHRTLHRLDPQVRQVCTLPVATALTDGPALQRPLCVVLFSVLCGSNMQKSDAFFLFGLADRNTPCAKHHQGSLCHTHSGPSHVQ
jgi:hypothetical protein